MKYRATLILLVIFLISACATPTFQACRNGAVSQKEEWKYTQIQAEVACERVVLKKAAKFNKEKGIWEINPAAISIEEERKVLEDRAKSLDEILSYKNRELSDFVNWFKGMRQGLEKEEKITLWLLRRIQFVDTFNKFTNLVGELPKEMLGQEAEYFMPYGRNTYSLRMLYPSRDLYKMPFTALYLETAKKEGIFSKIDSFYVSDYQKYAKKLENLRDPNEFSWEERQRGWKVDSYMIIPAGNLKPSDNIVQYIEIYRVDENGKAELFPAVRGFLAAGAQKVTVFVIDYNKQGEDGFGSPDAVKNLFTSFVTGRDLYLDMTSRGDLFEALYDNSFTVNLKRPERQKPEEKLVYLEVVPMGKKVDVDVWENGNWTVPIEYLVLSNTLYIVYDLPKTPEETHLETKKGLKKIIAFKREFVQDGRKTVTETWIPRKDYSERNIVEASAQGVFKIRRKGGEEKSGDIEYFAERIKTIMYQFGGRWFQIVDNDGDGIFEKKKEIGDPTVTKKSAVNESFQ